MRNSRFDIIKPFVDINSDTIFFFFSKIPLLSNLFKKNATLTQHHKQVIVASFFFLVNNAYYKRLKDNKFVTNVASFI